MPTGRRRWPRPRGSRRDMACRGPGRGGADLGRGATANGSGGGRPVGRANHPLRARPWWRGTAGQSRGPTASLPDRRTRQSFGGRGRDEAGLAFAVTVECHRWDECAAFTTIHDRDQVLGIEYVDVLRGGFADACADPDRPGGLILRDRMLGRPESKTCLFAARRRGSSSNQFVHSSHGGPVDAWMECLRKASVRPRAPEPWSGWRSRPQGGTG